MICLGVVWMSRVAATNPHIEAYFFITAGLIGLVMGGLQSTSRSTYSKLIPPNQDSTTFFGLYDVLEKISIVTGTLVHGYLINRTGNTQASALALAGFFAVGAILLIQFRRHETSNRVTG
jgi:UMF1 family MFS transporter